MFYDDLLFCIKSISDNELCKIGGAVRSEIKRRKSIKKAISKDISEPEIRTNIIKKYSGDLYALPESRKYHNRIKFWHALYLQDWSSVYKYDSAFGDYYVYAHIDPRTWGHNLGKGFGGDLRGLPFYIGKGIGNRAYDLKRNQGHGKRILELKEFGFDHSDIVKIMFDGLSEGRALEIESKLIYLYGTFYDRGKNGCLLNLDIPLRPKTIATMKS